MPPSKPQGRILAEDHLAQRIELERTLRGWSYEGLAKRVTDAGCPISPSAIHKIEKANPRRRITVDEAIAYAEVFEIPVNDLLVPPKLAGKAEFVSLWEASKKLFQEELEYNAADQVRRDEFTRRRATMTDRLGELAQLDPSLRELLPELIAADEWIDPTKRDSQVAAANSVLDHYTDPKNRGGSR